MLSLLFLFVFSFTIVSDASVVSRLRSFVLKISGVVFESPQPHLSHVVAARGVVPVSTLKGNTGSFYSRDV